MNRPQRVILSWASLVLMAGSAPGQAPQPASDDHASAATRAEAELRRGLDLQTQYETLDRESFEHYQAKSLPEYSEADRKGLAELRLLMNQAFERAAQLDPAPEQAAWKSAQSAVTKMQGSYSNMVETLGRCTQYIERFPGGPHARGMYEYVITFELNLGRYLEPHGVRDSSLAAVPGDVSEFARREYYRVALTHFSKYVDRFIGVRDQQSDGSWMTFEAMMKPYRLGIDAYFRQDPPAKELQSVIADYRRAAVAHPEVLRPSEFLLLRYHTMKKSPQAYIETLAAMQKRWPDPKDPHWTLGQDEALQDLCDLLESDPRATNFYLWLRGKRGPGGLP